MKTELLTLLNPSQQEQSEAIQRAGRILSQGELVAFPTDTVYGLGALAWIRQAIDQLYTVKSRDTSKAIAVLIGRNSDLELVTAQLSQTALRLSERFWPGPLTLVVQRHPSLPDNLSSEPTIGVRMPDHPLALALLQHTGPLAVTSANLSGQPNTTTASEVLNQLGNLIPLILDGGHTPGGQPSSVVDCTGPGLKILRQGSITLRELELAL